MQLATGCAIFAFNLVARVTFSRHLMGEDLITHLGFDYYQDLVKAL
jgi:hypothetical protein